MSHGHEPGPAQSFELTPLDLALYAITGPVASFTLMCGWTDGTTTQLKAATHLVVEQNPFLAGRIRRRAADGAAIVEAGGHTEFIVEIDGPVDFAIPHGTKEAIALLHSLERRFAQVSIGRYEQLIQSGGPLFRIILMKLSADYMAYAVEVNHMIADGCTHYQIQNLINCAVNGRSVPELDWKPAPEAVAFPALYNGEDKEMALTGWLPSFMEKCGEYAPGTENARIADVTILTTDSVAALKKEYQAVADAEGLKYLSTNDLIVAGLTEVVEHGANCHMIANMRDRMPGVSGNVAGNYERVIHFPASKAAATPTFVRLLNKTWGYFGQKGNPRLSSEGGPKEAGQACNFLAVTNWASLTHFIEPAGTCVVAHCAPSNYVTDVAGFDLAVIFKADSKGTLAVLSNHLAGKRGEELREQMSRSEIFSRLFEREGPGA
mmetsp:Transcript_12499/g.24325  ORF Transcript_12499/g.24325 Transcript_12499/m.24325 type:complete len:435 (-) Transcript_12499:240-1544(-)|eukprot:CAMPEP_0172715920 /NCGR_PEP_ID=MMETSP1074-20121228/67818_1 /TAXON_ID=2916 /ORGANISM="Ceratium fusus, Strain PA161109" /LENGTH=434 /DNA_ID=CAMNT_0013540545 /DNA_START=60 /DNA_END=1364 /DNA_ORIENTATION=+